MPTSMNGNCPVTAIGIVGIIHWSSCIDIPVPGEISVISGGAGVGVGAGIGLGVGSLLAGNDDFQNLD